MKEESEKTYTYYRKAQYHETDQMGIIHHSNYVKWMEEARIGYMSRMGFSYKKVEELGVISPVVEISVAYRKQVFFDDEIRIRVGIKQYNGISLEFNYEFFTKFMTEHHFAWQVKIVAESVISRANATYSLVDWLRYLFSKELVINEHYYVLTIFLENP